MMTPPVVRGRLQVRPADPAVRRRPTPDTVADEIRVWIHDVDELGEPRFGELALLLHGLREAVAAQGRENRRLPASRRPDPDPELVLDRLDLLKARLEHADLYYNTWQQACREFEDICDGY